MSRDAVAAAVAGAVALPASGSPSPAQCLEMGRACACSNLRRAARAVTQVFDAHFEAFGLKATQFTVLAVLSYSHAEPLTVTSLADALVLEQDDHAQRLSATVVRAQFALARGDLARACDLARAAFANACAGL